MVVWITIGPELPVLSRGSANGARIGVVDDDDDDDDDDEVIADKELEESRESLSFLFLIFFCDLFFSSAPWPTMSPGISLMAENTVD